MEQNRKDGFIQVKNIYEAIYASKLNQNKDTLPIDRNYDDVNSSYVRKRNTVYLQKYVQVNSCKLLSILNKWG